MGNYERVAQGGRVWDFKKNPTLEGVLVKKEFNIGPNKSAMYTIHLLESEEDVKMWGATALDGQMENIGEGQQVKISYEGLKDSPKRPGKQFHAYNVFAWKD